MSLESEESSGDEFVNKVTKSDLRFDDDRGFKKTYVEPSPAELKQVTIGIFMITCLLPS